MTIIPPWPVVIILLGAKLKHPASPKVPKNLLPLLEVNASAASSITLILFDLANFINSKMFPPLPET